LSVRDAVVRSAKGEKAHGPEEKKKKQTGGGKERDEERGKREWKWSKPAGKKKKV